MYVDFNFDLVLTNRSNEVKMFYQQNNVQKKAFKNKI